MRRHQWSNLHPTSQHFQFCEDLGHVSQVSTETKEACDSGNFLAVSFRRSTTANPQALVLQAKEHVSHYQQKQNRETICQNKQAFCSSKQFWQGNHDKWRRKEEGTVNRDKCTAELKEVQYCFLRDLNYSALRCMAFVADPK